MSYIKLDPVDHFELAREVKLIADQWPPIPGQLMVQGTEGHVDPSYGTGRVAEFEHEEKDFTCFLHDTPYLNSLVKKYGMYRTRIMTMGKMCYSWHCDETARIHIPVYSLHEYNFMVIENDVIRMPVGDAYWTDTTMMHTYVNTIDTVRTHIVGCVK